MANSGHISCYLLLILHIYYSGWFHNIISKPPQFMKLNILFIFFSLSQQYKPPRATNENTKITSHHLVTMNQVWVTKPKPQKTHSVKRKSTLLSWWLLFCLLIAMAKCLWWWQRKIKSITTTLGTIWTLLLWPLRLLKNFAIYKMVQRVTIRKTQISVPYIHSLTH